MDKDMIRKILTSMIRPRLEYATVVWSPNMEKDIRKLERIKKKKWPQKWYQKLLRELTYEDILKEMEEREEI